MMATYNNKQQRKKDNVIIRTYNGLKYRVTATEDRILDRIQERAVQVGSVSSGTLQARPGASRNSLLLEGTYRPGWTIWVAVLFFPIGMLALLVKEHTVLNVSTRSGSDGKTLVTVSGDCENQISNALLRVLGVDPA